MTAGLASSRDGHMPLQLDARLVRHQALDQLARFVDVDLVAKAARSAKGQTEELELVGRGPGAVGQQLDAARAHFRVGLVRQQLQPVVHRADRAQQIVAQARAQQAGEFGFGQVAWKLGMGGGWPLWRKEECGRAERRKGRTAPMWRKGRTGSSLNAAQSRGYGGWWLLSVRQAQRNRIERAHAARRRGSPARPVISPPAMISHSRPSAAALAASRGDGSRAAIGVRMIMADQSLAALSHRAFRRDQARPGRSRTRAQDRLRHWRQAWTVCDRPVARPAAGRSIPADASAAACASSWAWSALESRTGIGQSIAMNSAQSSVTRAAQCRIGVAGQRLDAGLARGRAGAVARTDQGADPRRRGDAGRQAQ